MTITLENLFAAWEEFKEGKQGKPDVMRFERNLEDNLFELYEDLSKKTYVHQPYHAFHIFDPKHRLIHKACVRDRVVHHLLFRYLENIFAKRFIYHSYSCQKEKGIHKAVEDLAASLRKVSRNYTETVWALKMDIQKFFDSLDHEVLLRLVFSSVPDRDMRWLCEVIIGSYHSAQGPMKGVPIGNLTSQIFANIYLHQFDAFVKHRLHFKNYFRYADDFVFLSHERAPLDEVQTTATSFLNDDLYLTVHPRKIIMRKFLQGIDFLGYVLLPHYRVLRTKTKQRMFKKIKERTELFNQELINEYSLEQSMQSYFGVLSHCSGHKIEETLRNKAWIAKRST